MSKKFDFMKELSSYDDAVNNYVSPHSNVVRITRSPSVNFAFGNGHGLPAGFTLMLYGPQEGGKTITCYDTVGTLHMDDPDAVAIRWDTEGREILQMSQERARIHNIDMNRYKCFSTNDPSAIFDRFEKDIPSMCERGMKLKLAIIDSTSRIQGRREMDATSVTEFQIGDHAQTMQAGLKFIQPVIRKYGIALILVTHLRAEFDQQQVRRHQTVKPQAAYALKHFCEFFGYVEKDETVEGRRNLLGEEFIDPSLKDIRGGTEGEITGHKVRFIMRKSSAGPRGRQGAFTYDYHRGIINTHEEVFVLGKNRGIIDARGAHYSFQDRKWQGKEALLRDLETDLNLQSSILHELKIRDLAGTLGGDEESPKNVPDIESNDV